MDKTTLRQEIEHHEGGSRGSTTTPLASRQRGSDTGFCPARSTSTGATPLSWTGRSRPTSRSAMRARSVTESLPEDVQHVIVGLAFNLGLGRLLGFKRFKAALMSREWAECAAELIDSRWYTQTGRRARDYVEVFRQSASRGAPA